MHGLAAQSGGKPVLRSRKGEGNTVEIWLSAARKRTAENASPRIQALPGAGASRQLTILVVDDDALVLASTVTMLEEVGHHVIEASSEQEALTSWGRRIR